MLTSGYLYAVLAAALWATSGTLSKSLFNGGVTPLQLVQLRTTIAAAVLFACLLARTRGSLAIRRADLGQFILLGIVLALSQVTYLYAISRIQVAVAILLQYQAPVLIALHAFIFDKRRFSLFTVGAIGAATAGCYLVAGAYNQSLLSLSSAGIISGLGSAVAFAVYTVKSGTVMQRYRPITVVFYALLFAALFWNILQRPFSSFAGPYGVSEWLRIIAIGVFGTILPFVFYSEGIRRIGPTHTAVAATVEPVFAGILSYTYLAEGLEPVQMFGALLVIAAVIILRLLQDGSGMPPDNNADL